jgi:hypothetical protein
MLDYPLIIDCPLNLFKSSITINRNFVHERFCDIFFQAWIAYWTVAESLKFTCRNCMFAKWSFDQEPKEIEGFEPFLFDLFLNLPYPSMKLKKGLSLFILISVSYKFEPDFLPFFLFNFFLSLCLLIHHSWSFVFFLLL